jgi:hypothetical protein
MHKITASLSLLTLALCSAAQAAPAARIDVGPVGVAASAERILEVKPATRYLNVRNGETVAIREGERSVTWFVQAAPNVSVVPLSRIVPRDAAGPEVLVYIAPGPQYLDF